MNKDLHLAISKGWSHIQEALILFLKDKDQKEVYKMLSIAKAGIEEAMQMIEASGELPTTINDEQRK